MITDSLAHYEHREHFEQLAIQPKQKGHTRPICEQIALSATKQDKLSMISGVVLATPKVLPTAANSSSQLKTACLHMVVLPVSFVSGSKILSIAIDMDASPNQFRGEMTTDCPDHFTF
ncbi:hypothetical protein ABZP36_020844 [Zizania latifolia]